MPVQGSNVSQDQALSQVLTLSDGRQVGYAEWGDPAGMPVVYCHGFPGSRLEARLADGPAKALGIRLIAPDRPGFGISSPDPTRTLATWPNDLVEIADHLGLSRIPIVGVSGGAPYAMASAQQSGDRVEKLALVCGLGELVDDTSTSGMNPAAALSLRFHQRWPRLGQLTYRQLIGPVLRRYPAGIFRILVGNGTPADRAVLAEPEVRSAIIDSFAEAFHAGAAGPAQELALITRRWDVDPAQVFQPVQLWHGEADRTVPVAMGRRYATLLPDVDARFIPGEGHFSLVVRYMGQILEELVGRSAAGSG
jgi:pimeloyl-ACP methyl ester carboxylesterase